jgi:uncharacterized coiled-coil DUF342 family protein
MAIDAPQLLEENMNMLTDLGDLAAALDENKALKAQVAAFAADKAKIDNLKEALKSCQDELEEALASATSWEEKFDEADKRADDLEENFYGDTADAVHAFLDEVERPVGQFEFTVPPTPAASRTILKLYDVIGRRL